MSDSTSSRPNTPPPTDASKTQLESMAQIIIDLQQMIHDLKLEIQASRQETAKTQQAFLDFVNNHTSSPSPSQTIPETVRSIPSPTTSSSNKKSNLTQIMIKSIQNQDHLLETFVNAQTSQFLTLQQLKKNKPPTSSTFPKFGGKSRDEFLKWETNILNILSTDEWSDLYDYPSQDAVSSGHVNPTLNNHLYKNISNQLTGNAKTIMDAKTHLRGDGISLLQALRQTYKATLNNVTLSAKFAELTGGTYFRSATEDIDTFAARTISIAKDLTDNGWPVTSKILKNSFIMRLGPDFTDIIEKHNTNKLPPEWLSHDLNDLMVPAKDHLDLKVALRNHNKSYKQHFTQTPTPPNSQDNSSTTSTVTSQRQISPQAADRQHRIRIAIENGTYKESMFTPEVKPNCCIWHNTQHLSSMCWVLRNMLRKHSTPTSTSSIPSTVAQPPPSTATVVSHLTANTRPVQSPNPPQSTPTNRYPQSSVSFSLHQPRPNVAKQTTTPPASSAPTAPASSASTSSQAFPDMVEIDAQLTNLDDFDLNS